MKSDERIAKNTIFLYIRTFVTMAVTLYTSRVILKYLGVEDYGIYNVVGGIVAMMGILNNAMSTASQRFFAYELGRGDVDRLKETFNACFIVYIGVSVLFVLLAETIGLWFLHTKLNIPEERMAAANWVYQFSIVASVISLLSNPYNAAIIAHERMKIYAHVSILEAVLKLVVVFMLPLIPIDRLVMYAFFVLLCQTVIRIIYQVYCRKNFQECKYVRVTNRELFKQILSFSGWNLYGSFAVLMKTQGLNILLNLFFTPVVNASRGIANQVNAAVTQFFSSFYSAIRPQIIKNYARKDYKNAVRLVTKSSVFSFYLILIVCLPLFLETRSIIYYWLGQIPEHVVCFTQLMLLITVFDSMAHPLMTLVQASGKLRLYQIIISSLIVLNIPVSYLFLTKGFPPNTVFIVSLLISIVCFFVRIFYVLTFMDFPWWMYIKKVFFKSIFITMLSAVLPLWVKNMLNNQNIDFLQSCIVVFVSVLSAICVVWLVGMSRDEKKFIMNKIFKRV